MTRFKRLISALSLQCIRVLVSAAFWYLLLAVSGVVTFSCGVALEFGRGYGLIAFGALAIVGSEAIRSGLSRG